MEGDPVNLLQQIKAQISTHALTWRATLDRIYRENGRLDFYPRPHMEGDRSAASFDRRQKYFYPRPHMEGDLRRQTGELPNS